MINAAHVELSLARIKVFFDEASEVIESLKPGEKIPATVLAKNIAEKHGMTGAKLYPALLFLFADYPGVKVLRGAHGGIMKLDPNKKDSPVVPESSIVAGASEEDTTEV